MARKYNKQSLSAKSHVTRGQQQQEAQQFEMETLDLPGMLLRKKTSYDEIIAKRCCR